LIRLSILSISVLDFLIPYILFRLTDANIRNFIEYPWNFIEYPWNFIEKQRKSEKFIPQITPILCSKTYSLQILLKFLAFFLAVSNFLLTFATVYKMIVIYPAGRPFRLWLLAAGFFYA